MATATPTRTFNEVDFFFTVEFQAAYFDVSYEGPHEDSVNLIVTKQVESYQERNFEDRLIGEMRFAGQHTCYVYSAHPLNFTHLRLGKLLYQGVERGEDFGPFHAYVYKPKPQ